MGFATGPYFYLVTATIAVLAVLTGAVRGESRLQSYHVKPNVAHDQSTAEANISKARFNRSPRIYEKIYDNWPRTRKVAPYNRYEADTAYDYRTSNPPQSYRTAFDAPRRDEPDFWPTPMQHHVEHKPKELPKMFYLKPVNHERRPPVYGDGEERTHWRHSTRINRPGAHSNLNEDGTYRLPGPRPQAPRFRQLDERPRPRQPNVQVSYDYEENRRPFHKQQVETELSLAIAKFVHQHLAEFADDGSARQEPEFNDIEVFVRFVDRKKRQAKLH